MHFTTAFLALAAIVGINTVVAGPACAAAASRPVPESLAKLTPEQEANVYNQIRSTWSNKTLELEAQLFAQRSEKAIGKRCNSCSGNLDFALCVSSECLAMLPIVSLLILRHSVRRTDCVRTQ
jgi:hypothetical protein